MADIRTYMNFTPTPQKREAGFVSTVLLVLSVISFLFSGVNGIPPLPLQLISLACAVAGVYVAVRYVFTTFTYSITAKNGGFHPELDREYVDLCISKTQGSRGPVTECRLSMDKLTQITEYTNELVPKLRAKHGKVSLYHYTVQMTPKKRHALVFDDGGECICLVIEADSHFLTALSSYIPQTYTEI